MRHAVVQHYHVHEVLLQGGRQGQRAVQQLDQTDEYAMQKYRLAFDEFAHQREEVARGGDQRREHEVV
eukprot:5464797-Pyramimonas_sp.AAC.1